MFKSSSVIGPGVYNYNLKVNFQELKTVIKKLFCDSEDLTVFFLKLFLRKTEEDFPAYLC